MSNNLVSMDNLLNILKGVKSGVVAKINAKDVTAAQKTALLKADSIITTGDGTSFLADNGTYKAVDVTSVNDIHTKTQTVMNLFNISYTNDTLDTTSINTTMPTILTLGESVIYNSKIYYIGGCTTTPSTVNSNLVQIYDIASNTWSTGANMPAALRYHRAIVYNSKIYVIGGNSGSATVPTTYIYDIASNTWSTGANILTAVYGFGCILYNNKIYCIDGANTSGVAVNLVQIYDIASNTWSTGTAAPTVRYQLRAEQYNGKIYCVCGFSTGSTTGLSTVEIYDIVSNSWSTVSVTNIARGNISTQVRNGIMYIIGGQNGTTYYNTIEAYNISTGYCAPTTSLSAGEITSTVIYNDIIYIIGGYTGSVIMSGITLFKFGITNFTLNLPTDLQAKLNLIPDTPGDGTLVLADNGTYIPVPLGYRFMTDAEVSSQVSTIIAYTG